MNYKSNKIFTKSCAVVLAVSNIFSGVSAAPEKKIKSSSISLTPKELAGSIFGTAGLSILATLFLSKMFSAQSTPAAAKKDNNSANSGNSNAPTRSSNSSSNSSVGNSQSINRSTNQQTNSLSPAPPRVDTEDDSQTADST